jgi:hypothetical protein
MGIMRLRIATSPRRPLPRVGISVSSQVERAGSSADQPTRAPAPRSRRARAPRLCPLARPPSAPPHAAPYVAPARSVLSRAARSALRRARARPASARPNDLVWVWSYCAYSDPGLRGLSQRLSGREGVVPYWGRAGLPAGRLRLLMDHLAAGLRPAQAARAVGVSESRPLRALAARQQRNLQRPASRVPAQGHRPARRHPRRAPGHRGRT